MAEQSTRYAVLLRYYQAYLESGETARFIASVANHYTLGSLERLVVSGEKYARRAAAMALGLLGDSNTCSVLGPLLAAKDRKLRIVADDSMRAILGREGSVEQRRYLEKVVRSNECATFERSIDLATELIDNRNATTEIFHQRSLALFQMDALEHAIDDCHEVLKRQPFHYGAMVGLGHCHLELGDLLEALYWFRKSLETFPDLEPVRLQVKRLGKSDSRTLGVAWLETLGIYGLDVLVAPIRPPGIFLLD